MINSYTDNRKYITIEGLSHMFIMGYVIFPNRNAHTKTTQHDTHAQGNLPQQRLIPRHVNGDDGQRRKI
jgi:hypothetical protein